MKAGFAYFFGYPRRQWRYAAAMIVLAGLMAYFAFFGLLAAYHETELFWRAFKGAVGAFAAWGSWHFASSIFIASIVPYFDRTVGVTGTFAQGAAVARNCRRLDELAAEQGIAPLSSFGFADDLRGEPVTWHEPRAGIEAISRLLSEIDAGGADTVLARELEAIRGALETTAGKGAKFALILRSGDGTNAREHALRAGSFF
jgi:hypothetical protein